MSLLCTYRLNWARRTSRGWSDEWDYTALQKQDSKFKPSRSEAEHATSQSQRLPTILSFTSGWGRNILLFFFKPPRPGNVPWTLAWKVAVRATTLRKNTSFLSLRLVPSKELSQNISDPVWSELRYTQILKEKIWYDWECNINTTQFM